LQGIDGWKENKERSADCQSDARLTEFDPVTIADLHDPDRIPEDLNDTERLEKLSELYPVYIKEASSYGNPEFTAGRQFTATRSIQGRCSRHNRECATPRLPPKLCGQIRCLPTGDPAYLAISQGIPRGK